jgi:ribosomal protein S18 acetylase RimI-like enzyme
MTTITRITETRQLSVSQFNTLLDDDKVWDEAQAAHFLSQPDNALFIAFVGDKEVGFATAYRLQRFDNLRAEVLLYEIGVEEGFRRQGIASELISAVKKWATEIGAAEVWVLTEEDNNAAKSLYKATGGGEEKIGSTMFTYSLKK